MSTDVVVDVTEYAQQLADIVREIRHRGQWLSEQSADRMLTQLDWTLSRMHDETAAKQLTRAKAIILRASLGLPFRVAAAGQRAAQADLAKGGELATDDDYEYDDEMLFGEAENGDEFENEDDVYEELTSQEEESSHSNLQDRSPSQLPIMNSNNNNNNNNPTNNSNGNGVVLPGGGNGPSNKRAIKQETDAGNGLNAQDPTSLGGQPSSLYSSANAQASADDTATAANHTTGSNHSNSESSMEHLVCMPLLPSRFSTNSNTSTTTTTPTNASSGGGGGSLRTRLDHLNRQRVSGLRRYKCPYCPATYGTNGNVKRHVRDSHIGARPYECPHCSICFKHKFHLERHIAQVHSGDGTFSCPQCPSAKFKTLHNLAVHQKMHTMSGVSYESN